LPRSPVSAPSSADTTHAFPVVASAGNGTLHAVWLGDDRRRRPRECRLDTLHRRGQRHGDPLRAAV